MTEDELKAIDQRLAAMSERVDAVIERESRKAAVLIPDDGKVGGSRRLHPMPILDFKPRPKARYVPEPEPDIEPMWACEKPRGEDCLEQIFAEFERQFDEMAEAHRYRG